MASTDPLSELLAALTAAKRTGTLEELLRKILTESELQAINTRLKILNLLEQGYSQREIAKQLGVGIATVSRGARELKRQPK